jgi:hypothetical protein
MEDCMVIDGKQQICKDLMVLAPAVFLGAAVGMLYQCEPFYTWFYCFAWWCYIIFVEAWLHHRGGASLLFSAPRRFLALLPLSVNIWLVFEVFNFRLCNWSYVDVPAHPGIRWLGYTISFATVLPGIFTTFSLLEHLGVIKSGSTTPLTLPKGWYRPCAVIGLAFLLLPIIWPKYFFPLVWGGFIFLLEPVNHHFHANSLLREGEQGSFQRFYLLLLAGAFCGFLWEFWNFWAGSKWVYSIPYVHFLKIFEMPVLGFLGFPPFAVECYVMVASVQLVASRLKESLTRRQYAIAALVLITLLALLDCWIYREMDRLTVISYRG